MGFHGTIHAHEDSGGLSLLPLRQVLHVVDDDALVGFQSGPNQQCLAKAGCAFRIDQLNDPGPSRPPCFRRRDVSQPDQEVELLASEFFLGLLQQREQMVRKRATPVCGLRRKAVAVSGTQSPEEKNGGTEYHDKY